MTWYAAHIIIYQKFKDGIQNKYPIFENVVLIEAASYNEALTKATQIGHDDYEYTDESNTWENRPATLTFGGIRKLIECLNPEDRPTSGTEVTYSEFEVESEEDFNKLINGETVIVKYEE